MHQIGHLQVWEWRWRLHQLLQRGSDMSPLTMGVRWVSDACSAASIMATDSLSLRLSGERWYLTTMARIRLRDPREHHIRDLFYLLSSLLNGESNVVHTASPASFPSRLTASRAVWGGSRGVLGGLDVSTGGWSMA